MNYSYINGKAYKKGYTTGSCATAATKAALLFALFGAKPEYVEICTPKNIILTLKIDFYKKENDHYIACVTKDAGDDIDATHNIKIESCVLINKHSSKIDIKGGIGVGKVTKKGLGIEIGDFAINKTPMEMIYSHSREILGDKIGAFITISAPAGEEISKKTFNPRLGIVGGISILGTTGIVEPMSEEAFKTSLALELKMLKEQNINNLILTPGNIGTSLCKILDLNESLICKTSNFIGFMLDEAKRLEFNKILILGHVSKLMKISAGIFHTHSRIADARQEILIANLALLKMPYSQILELSNEVTIEGCIPKIFEFGYPQLFNILANKAVERIKLFNQLDVCVGLCDLSGNLIGKNNDFDKNLKFFKKDGLK